MRNLGRMFHLTRKREIKYFQSDIFDDENFSHAFSTRIRGKSSDFALMDKSDEKSEQITQNRKDFCEVLGINFDNLIIPEQKHTSNIQIVSKGDKFNPQNTDGIIIHEENMPAMLFFADCTPIILYAKEHGVFALLHAGWRGTAGCIAKKAVEKMEKDFGIAPEKIKAAIGACISRCCFEINQNTAEKLAESIKTADKSTIFKKNEKIYADLKQINALQLREAGIKLIDTMEYCSVCQNDLFFSYRKENSTGKRHCIVAQIKKK